MLLSLVLLIRIVANPLSNVFQKLLTRHGAAPRWIIFLTFALLTFIALPICWLNHAELRPGFWGNIITCGLLAVAGNVALVEALRHSDLSVLGPINAYKSVVSLAPAILFLHEWPSRWQLLGILLIVVGSVLVVDAGGRRNRLAGRLPFSAFWHDRGIRFRLLALVMSATEAVFLKRAIYESSALTTFAWWALIGCMASLLYTLLGSSSRQTRHELRVLRNETGLFIVLAITTALMQLCTLLTFEAFAVGPALALFQTSAIVTVILGNRVFQEGHFLRRLAGSAIMVCGAIQIVTTRSHG